MEKHTPVADRSADRGSDTATPLWVKVFGIIVLALVLLSLILMFTRGPHRGPRDHMSSGAASGRAPIESQSSH